MMDRPAGFWIRAIAYILDGVFIAIPLIVINFLLGAFGLHNQTFFEILTYTVNFLYMILMPVYFSGCTIGKMLCKISIAKHETLENPTLWMMIKRQLLFFGIVFISFGIAIIVDVVMIVVRDDKRSLHDIIAGTVVVHT